MGVTSAENGDTAMDMITAKPRERQFQVVPVPGKFTRGRWQCWDYRDEKPDVSDEILDFTDKAEKSAPPATLPVASEAQPLSNVNAAQQQSDVLLTHTVSEPMLITQCGGGGAAQVAPDMPLGTQPTSAHKESSTIVVTSIAPAAVTPVHGTPSSSVDMANGVDTNIANVQVPSAMTIVSSDVGSEDVISPPQTLSNAGITLSTSSASIPIGTASSQDGCGVPCSTSPSVPAVPANSFVNPSIMSAAPTPSPLPQQSSAQGTAPTTLSRQTSLASFHDGGAAPVISTLTPIDGAVEDPSAAGNVPGGPNVVAIDNKIEQAMDLVKTHLTFAVREEVEILRSTIVDLEAKVAQLESQNQVLKQFAPAEVVANLALLVQNAQQQKQLQQQKQVQSAAVSATATAAQPAVAPPAQSVIVNAQPAVHSAQVQQPQLPVGVVPAPVPVLTNVSGADLNTIVPTSISSVGDAPIATATASQLSSTLNSMAVNVSSSASSTTTL